MNNGCICCTARGDLIRIIIETTGLADPSPAAQTFCVDDELRTRSRLDLDRPELRRSFEVVRGRVTQPQELLLRRWNDPRNGAMNLEPLGSAAAIVAEM